MAATPSRDRATASSPGAESTGRDEQRSASSRATGRDERRSAAGRTASLGAAAKRHGGWAARRVGRQLEHTFGGAKRTRVIVVLAAVLALSSADTATVGAAAGPLRSALHISNTEVGLLVTVSSLVAAVASVPFGILADRVTRTRVLGVSVAFWGVAMVWSATAANFDRLLLTRVFLGVVTASAGPVVASLVGDYFPSSERGRVYSYILTGELLGAGFGFTVTGDVAAISWRAAFVVLALPTVWLARALWRLPEPARGSRTPLLPEPAGGAGGAAGGSAGTAGAAGTAGGGTIGGSSEWFGAVPADAPVVDAAGASASVYDHEPRPDPTLSLPGTPPAAPHAAGWDAAAGSEAGEPDPAAPPETDAQRVARQRGVLPDPDRILQVDGRRLNILQATRYVLSVRTNVVLIVAGALVYYYQAGIETFGIEFASKQYGVPTALASLLLLVVGVGAVAGVLLGGGLSDWLLRKRFLNSRLLIAGTSAILTSVLFLPGIFTRSTFAALPYLAIAALFLTGQNAPIDAARLDIVPPPLWGRAEGIRTLLRTSAQSVAPLAFGALADVLGGGRIGLQAAFAVMLVPLAVSGVILLWAMRSYPQDVATAAAAAPTSDDRSDGRAPGRSRSDARRGRQAGRSGW